MYKYPRTPATFNQLHFTTVYYHIISPTPTALRDTIMFPHLPILSALAALTAALPTSSPSSTRQLSAEKWSIPRLNMHMMSIGTGIPGNPPWPEASKYNSTIDFDVLVPSQGALVKRNCQTSFRNGTLPEGWATCGKGGEGKVEFGMTLYEELGPRRAELSFVLHLTRTDGDS
jgi:hypothetical protein